MKYPLSKIFFIIILSFFFYSTGLAQTQCNSIKEIFENSDYCDSKKISVRGTISEMLDSDTLSGSKYIFGFWIINENKNRIRVISADNMVLIEGNTVMIDGRYYKKLYANGLNLDDTIVASSNNIQVILTAEELWNDILGPYGESLNTGRKLVIWNKVFIAIIPLFSAVAFYFGLAFYKRRQYRGASFEGHVESLFRRQDWRLVEDNSYRKLNRWVESYSHPDFVFIHRKTNQKIAVECKYKEKEYERILWAYEDQIEHYQDFSAKEKMPVFVIIGIGGRPKNPKRMFLAPLLLVKYPDVKMDYLRKFERDPKRPFLLDNNGSLV